MKINVGASILAGDFGRLADEAKRIADGGADSIHIDIMDGHFVPNLTMGPNAVAAINRATDLFLDVHLMVYNPFEYVERFIEMGADMITFHFEATEDIEDTLAYIRKCNVKAGLAFNPETSIEMGFKYLSKADLFLLMTVNPGFVGQKFMTSVLEKIKRCREVCNQLGIKKGGLFTKAGEQYDIQVDGGINLQTAKLCVDAGANCLVSGHYLFSEPNMKAAIVGLKGI